MDKLRRVLNGEEERDDEAGILSQVSDSTTLGWGTRLRGFLACFVLGVFLSILGSVMLFLGNLTAFAVLYSLGTITSLISTCFLMGPWKQMKKMFDPNRLIATLVMLLMVVLTILSAVLWKNAILALLFCILQFLALIWYSISYIPFARDAVMKCFGL